MFRRFISIILLGALAITLAGCNGKEQQPAADDNAGSEKTEQVDNADEVTEEENDTVLTFIGHASIKLKAKDGRIVLIDPQMYSATEYEDEADFVLVTHGHGDHLPCNQVKLKENGVKITWEEALVDGEYQSWDFDGIKIEAVVAGGNANHPIGFGVGYLVTIDGICVYHAGDSSNDEALHVLKDRKIDYAMYPIDGVYNMGPEEATELANIIGAANNIPIHMSNTKINVDKRDRFTPEGRLIVDEKESIVLGE